MYDLHTCIHVYITHIRKNVHGTRVAKCEYTHTNTQVFIMYHRDHHSRSNRLCICGTIVYAVHINTILHTIVQYCALRTVLYLLYVVYTIVQYCTVLCTIVQYCTMVYSTGQYCEVLCTILRYYCTVLYKVYSELGVHKTTTVSDLHQFNERQFICTNRCQSSTKEIHTHVPPRIATDISAQTGAEKYMTSSQGELWTSFSTETDICPPGHFPTEHLPTWTPAH